MWLFATFAVVVAAAATYYALAVAYVASSVCVADLRYVFDVRDIYNNNKSANSSPWSSVQGSAAPSFWAWWDKAWLRALHRHIATGGTSQDVSVARHQALAALQAVAVRCTTIALLRLQTDPKHPAGRP